MESSQPPFLWPPPCQELGTGAEIHLDILQPEAWALWEGWAASISTLDRLSVTHLSHVSCTSVRRTSNSGHSGSHILCRETSVLTKHRPVRGGAPWPWPSVRGGLVSHRLLCRAGKGEKHTRCAMGNHWMSGRSRHNWRVMQPCVSSSGDYGNQLTGLLFGSSLFSFFN